VTCRDELVGSTRGSLLGRLVRAILPISWAPPPAPRHPTGSAAGSLHVLVTGASSGMGEELAYAYAALGASVALFARRRDRLEHVAAECLARGATQALALPGDTTLAADVIAAARTLAMGWPRIDRAFLNAGGGGGATSWDPVSCCSDPALTPQHFSAAYAAELMQLNYGGSLLWLEQLFPEMARTGGGKIALTGSMAADGLLLSSGPYMASKMAVRGLVLGLRAQAAALSIDLALIEPGFVDTPQTGGKRDLPFLISATEAARQISNQLERGVTTIRVPRAMSVSNRLAGWLPTTLYAAAMRRLYPTEPEPGDRR
jgi:NAD(P)-dependent dehydrogenase (short-subunit alcohol dehydrogenase family)